MNKKMLSAIIIVSILIISGIIYIATTDNNKSAVTMISSLIPLATGLLGYLGSIVTIEWRENSQYKREKKHREEERDLLRVDRRDTFQRETLLALQDKLSELSDITFQAYRENKSRGWQGKLYFQEDTYQKLVHTSREIVKLRARLLDKKLIMLIRDQGQKSLDVLFAKSAELNESTLSKCSKFYVEANGRIGELLKITN